MLRALSDHPRCEIACANERIWRERSGESWERTGATVWADIRGFAEYSTRFEDACGSAKLCNSSTVFKTANATSWQTPDDIPVDVTEHFRERLVKQPVLLVHEPLVNYSETLQTHRSSSGTLWSDYQSLLIGSCFFSLPSEHRVDSARMLWKKLGKWPSPRATSLLLASRATPEARSLWSTSSQIQRLRFIATSFRWPAATLRTLDVQSRLRRHWNFLCASSYNQNLSKSQISTGQAIGVRFPR